MSLIPKEGVLGNAKYAFLNATNSGATAIVAAVPGSKIRVVALSLVSTAANTVKFQSAANDKTSGKPLAANGGLVKPLNEHGWFETNRGEVLNFNQSAATVTGIDIVYVLVN